MTPSSVHAPVPSLRVSPLALPPRRALQRRGRSGYNGRDARWTRFNQEHGHRFRFVHTPLHASWINQVEIWFSILQRRVLRYGSFESVTALARDVLGFIRHWNRAEARPFRWTFAGRFVDAPGRLAP